MRIRLSLPVASLLIALAASLSAQQSDQTRPPREVALYVRDRVLGGDFGRSTLWMTRTPIDQTYVVRDVILDRRFTLPVPYPRAWLVMIDDAPGANFGHPVRWLFVDDTLTRHSDPIRRDFPPVVLTQTRESVPFGCVEGVTPTRCQEVATLAPSRAAVAEIIRRGCRYAVLVSGGINNGSNYSRYSQNLRSMYTKLRNCGYERSHIYVYYANGASLDLDNADGDNNDATGSDVTAGAVEATIRARIQTLCRTLDRHRDILFTYFTNHGADDSGVCLWDGNNDGLGANELYSPAELAADTADCSVCRHFMLHDQCYAGDFLPMASDGHHRNLAVYAAASATEVSWGREYMNRWETNDPAVKTMNAMHQDVVANGNLHSTAGMAEGTAGIGNVSPCKCCRWFWPWPYWYWIILAIIVIIPIVYWRLRPRPPYVGP